MKKSFSVKAWNDSKWSRTGGGYGLTISSLKDRDEFFKRKWKTVTLRLVACEGSHGCTAEANIDKNAFWKKPPQRVCSHLIKKEIGQWLIDCGFVNLEAREWSTGKGTPPQFRMFLTENKRIFEVRPE